MDAPDVGLETRSVLVSSHTSYYGYGVQRPAPIVTEDNAVFWDAADEGRLVAQRCAEVRPAAASARGRCARTAARSTSR